MAIRSKTAQEELRRNVRAALLHLGDPVWLSDSPLQGLAEVQRRAAGDNRLFAEGEALRSFLVEVVDEVICRLSGYGKVAVIRSTLEGVRRQESISAIARRAGRSREWWSRSTWTRASELVADEIWTRSRESKRLGH